MLTVSAKSRLILPTYVCFMFAGVEASCLHCAARFRLEHVACGSRAEDLADLLGMQSVCRMHNTGHGPSMYCQQGGIDGMNTARTHSAGVVGKACIPADSTVAEGPEKRDQRIHAAS